MIDDNSKKAAIESAFNKDETSPDFDHRSAYRRPGSKPKKLSHLKKSTQDDGSRLGIDDQNEMARICVDQGTPVSGRNNSYLNNDYGESSLI